MKLNLLITALLASAPAFANDIDPHGFDSQAFVSTRTRAEVSAEAREALRQGQIAQGEIYAPAEVSANEKVTRAAVKADLALARARGQLSPGIRPTL